MAKDIPPVEGRALQRIREELQILMGIRGDRMDAAMTLRGAIASGILVPGPGGVYFPGTSSEPDLTPPPDVDGLTVTAGFSQVLVQFTAPTYTQGHGNLRTNIYAVKKAPGDATLPTYEDGVTPLVSAAIGALNIVSIPSELNTRWHVWAKHETVDGVLSLNAAGGVNGYNVAGEFPTTGQDIAQLLEILTGEITESQLYNDLGDKIDIIGELQDGQAENAENTLKALIAVQDVADGTYAAILQEASVREDQTGALFAQWTVKLDVNGYVSGFGLASTSAGATPYSQFLVRADSFAIAAPSGPGIDPVVPFIVRTTSTTENGVTVPVGVYMDSAYIANVSAIYGRFGTLVADSIAAGQINAAHLTLGDGTVGGDLKSTAYTAGTGSTPGTGWKLTPGGNLYASNAVLYGTVYASAGELGTLNVAGGLTIGTTGHIKGGQTGYNTGTGYYIGYSGGAYKLSIGSPTSGLTWDGTALTINGGGTFSGALSAASGTFVGVLSAATGTFAGALSAATGSFAGSLSAATGTFAGTLTAAAVNAVDTINLAGNAVTVPTGDSDTAISFGSTETTIVAAAAIDTGGAPLAIIASVSFSATAAGPDSATVEIKVKFGSTAMKTKTMTVSLPVGGTGDSAEITVVAYDPAPASGSNSPAVTMRRTAGTATCTGSASLYAIGTKR